jgi:signal transduction histidine kinase
VPTNGFLKDFNSLRASRQLDAVQIVKLSDIDIRLILGRRPMSLFKRQVWAVLLPVSVALAVAWGSAVWLYSAALEARAAAPLQTAVDTLAGGNLPINAELLRRLSALQGAQYLVLDAGGAPVLATWSERPTALLAPAVPEGTHVRDIAGTPWVVVSRRLRGFDSRYARLIAAASLADTRTAAARAAGALAAVLLVSLGVLGLIMRRLVRGVTAPLQQLAGAAQALAAGQRDVRFEAQRDDEVGQLARVLNDMSVRLGDYESRLAARSRDAALGELSARVAHEIRNPLTGIKMHLQLLAEAAGAERPRLEQLLSEVRRLELIVNATLVLGRDAEPQRAALDLAALAGEVVELMRPAFQHRHVELDAAPSGPVEALADAGQLRQALLNLLVNAADALPDGGRIRVTAAADAQRARLIVEDSGPGLGTASAADKPLGLGIGLPLCRDIAARHGGALHEGRSATLGGARMELEIPLRT